IPRTYSATNADIRHPSANTRGAFARALTALVASCTMNWVRALSSAVRAFGLHPKGRPFKSDSAHHCDATPFSGDVVQLVRTLPCRWLESRTVTAEPQNQLPQRPSITLNTSSCLSRTRSRVVADPLPPWRCLKSGGTLKIYS